MKKILAIILILAMAVSLVACGGGEDSFSQDNNQNLTEENISSNNENVAISSDTGLEFTFYKEGTGLGVVAKGDVINDILEIANNSGEAELTFGFNDNKGEYLGMLSFVSDPFGCNAMCYSQQEEQGYNPEFFMGDGTLDILCAEFPFDLNEIGELYVMVFEGGEDSYNEWYSFSELTIADSKPEIKKADTDSDKSETDDVGTSGLYIGFDEETQSNILAELAINNSEYILKYKDEEIVLSINPSITGGAVGYPNLSGKGVDVSFLGDENSLEMIVTTSQGKYYDFEKVDFGNDYYYYTATGECIKDSFKYTMQNGEMKFILWDKYETDVILYDEVTLSDIDNYYNDGVAVTDLTNGNQYEIEIRITNDEYNTYLSFNITDSEEKLIESGVMPCKITEDESYETVKEAIIGEYQGENGETLVITENEVIFKNDLSKKVDIATTMLTISDYSNLMFEQNGETVFLQFFRSFDENTLEYAIHKGNLDEYGYYEVQQSGTLIKK